MTSGLGDDAAFSSWSDGGCRYRCPVCGPRQEDFRHSVHFWKHVAESHGLSPKDFARRQRQGQRHPNNLMVVKATMACEECPPGAPFVVFDYGKMVAHLIAKHENLTLRQYYDKHVAKNRSNLRPPSNTYVVGVLMHLFSLQQRRSPPLPMTPA